MNHRCGYTAVKQKRSRMKKRLDVNEFSVDIVYKATNEDKQKDIQAKEPKGEMTNNGKNAVAVALGRLCGLKIDKSR